MGAICAGRPRWEEAGGVHLNSKEKNSGTKRIVFRFLVENKGVEKIATH